MFRQVPGLPHGAAGSKRRPKKNKSGIDGRIMDPVARRAAQRAAKAIQTAGSLQSAPSSPSCARETDAARLETVQVQPASSAQAVSVPKPRKVRIQVTFSYFSLSPPVDHLQ
jgi:hypothetical protein